MNRCYQIIVTIILVAILGSCSRLSRNHLTANSGLIPVPTQLTEKEGHFLVQPQTKILVDGRSDEIMSLGRWLAERFYRVSGMELSLEPDSGKTGGDGNISLLLDRDSSGGDSEAYSLAVNPSGIEIKAQSASGVFYGLQTLRQLLPPQFEGSRRDTTATWQVRSLSIQDRPRFSWRGMMLDVSRHFFSKDFVLELIDYLARYKLNTLHLHLNDDQGWRIEIKKYPRLTGVGAWRVDRSGKHWNAREPQQSGETATVGGFYSQADIREIVAYARSRYITVIPEIEMPGHAVASLASYPEHSCTGGPFSVLPGGYWPISDIYCAGKDETFDFLENVLDEVLELFPSRYIHIGGDEAEKSNWKACPDCQARIKNEGLKDEHELQSYFIKRIEVYLNNRGRQLIGWDEILEGGLAPRAAVMSWRGTQGGITAARAGHPVVMSPTSHCYFDYYQGAPEYEPLAIGGFLPLEKVYSFEPIPGELAGNEVDHILGAQANLWTEYVATPEQAQYMLFPRLAALAEVVWSLPRHRVFADFTGRLESEFNRLDYRGIRYAVSLFNIYENTKMDRNSHSLQISLSSSSPRGQIRYTLDGTNPVTGSPVYSRPFAFHHSTRLKAALFVDGKRRGKIHDRDHRIHLASGRPVTVSHPYSERYSGGVPWALTDSVQGSMDSGDGRWQGYHQVDLIANVDLEGQQQLKKISTGFLQNVTRWIFLPTRVTVSVSADGQTFTQVADIVNDVSAQESGTICKQYTASLDGHRVRYVQIHAYNIGICPEWHVGAGDKAWLFVDEIIIE